MPLNNTLLLVSPFFGGLLGPIKSTISEISVVLPNCMDWTPLHHAALNMLDMADAICCLDEAYELLGDNSYAIWLDGRARPYRDVPIRIAIALDQVDSNANVLPCGPGCFIFSKHSTFVLKEWLKQSFLDQTWDIGLQQSLVDIRAYLIEDFY